VKKGIFEIIYLPAVGQFAAADRAAQDYSRSVAIVPLCRPLQFAINQEIA
jgi:hypothetical protein